MDRREFLAALGVAAAGVSLNRLWAVDEQSLSSLAFGTGGISFDKYSLKLNGARNYIFSGTIHYYRHPSPKQWESRIKKLKQSGFNTIDTYYYWGYHSPEQGEYDFKDSRDIELFQQMVSDNGMYLIARPGPYICAEVDGGGFPGWLLAKRELNLRCRKNGKFVYDPEYMKYVREWYEAVIPRINNAKSLVLLQIENEYGFYFTPTAAVSKLQVAMQKAYGTDIFLRLSSIAFLKALYSGDQEKAIRSGKYAAHNDYMKELNQMARSLGVKVPLFHNDTGTRYIDVDIPGVDNYPVSNFRSDWKKDNPFSGIDLFEKGRDALKGDSPMMAPEIQGGWYDLWGGYGYDHIRKHLGPLAMDMTLKSCLAQGTSILNIYMAAGGTTWGYTTEPEVYTSYDYGAPLTEGGRISERAEVCRLFSEFVAAHEQELLETDPVPELGKEEKSLFAKVRKNRGGDHFVFLRNLTGRDQKVRLPIGEFEVKYPGFDVLMLDKNGKLVDKLLTVGELQAEPMIYLEKKPALSEFSFSLFDQPLVSDPGYKKIAGKALDMDALGAYYGFVWYRARTRKKVKRLKADARHFWALYVNGELVSAFNNFRNMVGNGGDDARVFHAEIAESMLKDENVIVLLVESLGHNKGFMEDSLNPRGLVSVQTDADPLEWEALPGLVPGEKGITPRVDFAKIVSREEKVRLAHKIPAKAGLGIYRSQFELNLKGPDQPAVGVKLTRCSGKANIYINGWLIGRYWDKVGPQKLFYLPPGLTSINGSNDLVIVVWPWGKEIELGKVEITEYP